jgi:hypothetical protein
MKGPHMFLPIHWIGVVVLSLATFSSGAAEKVARSEVVEIADLLKVYSPGQRVSFRVINLLQRDARLHVEVQKLENDSWLLQEWNLRNPGAVAPKVFPLERIGAKQTLSYSYDPWKLNMNPSPDRQLRVCVEIDLNAKDTATFCSMPFELRDPAAH